MKINKIVITALFIALSYRGKYKNYGYYSFDAMPGFLGALF